MPQLAKLPVRDACHGVTPLRARLEPWMQQIIEHECLPDWVEKYDSPLNLVHTDPMRRNIDQLRETACSRGISFQVFFARKANKCLSFVRQAEVSGIGLDTASSNEVSQCLEMGVDPSNLICTAAVKSESLLKLCVDRQVCVAIDNQDEWELLSRVALQRNRVAKAAIRLGGFRHRNEKLQTRFGFDVERDLSLDERWSDAAISIQGVHFHLDGYDAAQRVSAIKQSMNWIKSLRSLSHPIAFLDMGGGFPMSYLQDENEWDSFWREHDRAIRGDRSEVTYRNHALGKYLHQGEVIGTPNSYPYFQSPVRADWFKQILDAGAGSGTVASLLKDNQLELRCEPGRSLLDGCGMTVARVEFQKTSADGDALVGISMNRTQCRTGSDDFLVDPIVIPQSSPREAAKTGYLVGAYCTEAELITLRKLRFPHGIRRGDLVVFPNTAGYLMHFLESRSHQFPLARNLVINGSGEPSVDPIDRETV